MDLEDSASGYSESAELTGGSCTCLSRQHRRKEPLLQQQSDDTSTFVVSGSLRPITPGSVRPRCTLDHRLLLRPDVCGGGGPTTIADVHSGSRDGQEEVEIGGSGVCVPGRGSRCAGSCVRMSRAVFQSWGGWAVAVLVLVVLLQTPVTLAFNVDVSKPIIQTGPNGSLFGYAVAQHIDQSTNWLLVGAPRTQTSQRGVTRGGAVFRCKTTTRNICQEMRFDTSGNRDGYSIKTGKTRQIEEKSNQWFGATVQSSGENGLVVACAPRYVYFSKNFDKREPIGMCYVDKASPKGPDEISPCKTDNFGFHRQGFCQAGLSAALSQNGRRLLIGAPGSWYWQGQIYNYKTSNGKLINATAEGTADEDDSYKGYASAVGDFDGDGVDDYVVGTPKGNGYLGKVEIYTQDLTNITTLEGEQIGSYFGSALAVTDLNDDNLDDIIVAAPFYADFKNEDSYDVGRVYIYYQTAKHQFPSQKRDILDGTDSQSRFGMALSKLGDINYDGFNDLCVSAPYGGEEGRGVIYIYHGSSMGIITKASQVIQAKELDTGLRGFGISVSGGMDQDGNTYPDILVGAHESDNAVFLRTRPVVRVYANLKLEPQNITLDSPSCNHLDKERVPCLTVYTCILYVGKGVPDELVFDLTWVLDDKGNSSTSKEQRAFYINTLNKFKLMKTEKIKKNDSLCLQSYAYVKSDPGDKLSPIRATLNFKLSEAKSQLSRSRRDVLQPILDAVIPTTTSFTAQIVKDCGKDNVCIPDLAITTIRVSPVHVIGWTSELEIIIIVANNGEDAFNTRLYITLPAGVKNRVRTGPGRSGIPVTCTTADTDDKLVICNLGNPMKKHTEIAFTLKVEPTNGNDTKDQLVFSLYANSTNNELAGNYKNNHKSVTINVTVEPDIDLKGNVQPDLIRVQSSDLDDVDKDEKRTVKHVYLVQNQGLSAINSSELQIRWPSFDEAGREVLKIDGKLDIVGLGTCKILNINPDNIVNYRGWGSNNTNVYLRKNKQKRATMVECSQMYCTIIQCNIGYMDPLDTFVLTISSKIDPYKFMREREVTQKYYVTSVALLKVTSVPYDFKTIDVSNFQQKSLELSTEITTEKHRPAGKGVEMWMIALAILAGLLFLLLLILLFWWCGFFKRKKPEEEEGYFVVNGKTDIDHKIFE